MLLSGPALDEAGGRASPDWLEEVLRRQYENNLISEKNEVTPRCLFSVHQDDSSGVLTLQLTQLLLFF